MTNVNYNCGLFTIFVQRSAMKIWEKHCLS